MGTSDGDRRRSSPVRRRVQQYASTGPTADRRSPDHDGDDRSDGGPIHIHDIDDIDDHRATDHLDRAGGSAYHGRAG